MKKTSKFNRWLLAAFAIMAAMSLAGCTASESGDDEDEPGNGFEQLPTTGGTLMKDVNTDDIDVFAEYALKMENLRLQYIKFTSNGWDGELFCGIGDKSDATGFINYLTDILENADRYTAAIQRLDQSAILTPTAGGTRGFFGDVMEVVFGLGREAKERREVVIQRLNDMHVMGNAKAQEELFEDLTPKYQYGANNAKEWFKNLYSGEYDSKIHAIDRQWQLLYTNSATQDYHILSNENSGPGLEADKSVHRTIAKAAVSRGKVYYGGIDLVLGGHGSNMNDAAEKLNETYELGKKAATGELTGKDIKKYITNRANDHLKDVIGDALGKELTGQALNLVAEEAADYVTEKALEESGSEKKAKDAGLSLVHIKGGIEMGLGGKMAIITDDEIGKVTVVGPDKNGDFKITMKPGKKTVTVVTDDGQRSTQKVEAKPGKVEVEAKPEPVEPTIALSTETVTMEAGGGKATVAVATNCRYLRSTKKSDDWFTVSRQGLQFTVTVDENTASEPRTGSFVIDVSTDGKTAALSQKVTVRQEAAKKTGAVTVSVGSFEFEAAGGSKTVSMTTGDYKYYGVFADSDCESWITIDNPNIDEITVKAAPNPNTQERVGTIYFFATTSPKPQTLDDTEYVTVKVTQKAGTGEIGEFDGKFDQISAFPHCYVIEEATGERIRTSEDIGFTNFCPIDKISVTKRNAKTWHVEGTGAHDNTFIIRTIGEYSLSFDIENVSEDFKNSVITNLHAKIKETKYDKNELYTERITEYYISNIPNIKFEETHHLLTLDFEGEVSSGLKFKSYETTIKWSGGMVKYTYSHDPTNSISVTISADKDKTRTPAARASGIPPLQRASVKAVQPK